MTPEIKYFQQLMKGNRMADYYASQAISGFNADLAQAFTGILRTRLLQYVELPDIRKQIDSSDDFNVQLKAVLDFSPSYLFAIVSELAALPGAYQVARRLLIAVVFYIIDRTTTHQSHIQLFIAGLQQKDKLDLSEEAVSDPESTVIPEIVYRDFTALARQPIRFQVTRSTPEMIENLFCISAISQIFLKYFFDLFAEAKNDQLSQQINVIFSRLFIALRLEEIRYWKGYKNSDVVKKRLLDIIDANSPKGRHPKLQKDVFAGLAAYNPIIHNGTSRGMTAGTQSLLKGQLAVFHSLSLPQTMLLMNIVHRFKGDDYIVYLVSQIVKTNRERLRELNQYLERLQQKSLELLKRLIGSFVQRFFPQEKAAALTGSSAQAGKPVADMSNASRLARAKKNIEEIRKRKGMMTHDMVTKYLEERLKKLYEKVKKSGALTADLVPKYLERFAEAAQSVLQEVNPAKQQELIEAFEESTDDILDEITRFSEMSNEEVDSIRSDIHDKMGELDTPDLEKRTEVVEQIGMTLSDVSEKVNPPARLAEKSPTATVNTAEILASAQISIGFDDKAPLVPLGEFFKLPFGERKGPPEEDWFQFHKRYLELAVENNRLEKSVLEALPQIEPKLPKLKYRKYFNIFPNGEYEDPTCSAVYDIWKSNALERLRVE